MLFHVLTHGGGPWTRPQRAAIALCGGRPIAVTDLSTQRRGPGEATGRASSGWTAPGTGGRDAGSLRCPVQRRPVQVSFVLRTRLAGKKHSFFVVPVLTGAGTMPLEDGFGWVVLKFQSRDASRCEETEVFPNRNSMQFVFQCF